VSIPATIGLIVVAAPLVDVLLGPDWEPVVVPLQILALNGIVKTFAATAGEVFQAQHRPYLRLVVEGSHLALVLPAIVVGAAVYGLNGVALAIVLVSALTGIPALVLVARSVGVGVRPFLAALERPAVGWVALTGSLLAVAPFAAGLPSWLELVVLVSVGVTVYLVAVLLFAREIAETMWRSLRGASGTGA
jgi:PST family polysaccharide transporter/lipopolysaccharide exporter